MLEKLKPWISVALVLGILGFGAWKAIDYWKSNPYDIAPETVVNTADNLVVTGPTIVKVGQLAIFDFSKSKCKTVTWLYDYAETNVKVFKGDRTFVFATNVPGDYRFIVVGTLQDEQSVLRLNLKVTAGPVPTPGPTPGPTPPPAPTSIVDQVVSWGQQVESKNRASEALQLSKSFSNLQQKISAGEYKSIDQVLEATKRANQQVLGKSAGDWLVFFQSLQTEMKRQNENGTMVTMDQHAQVWGEISKGLEVLSNQR